MGALEVSSTVKHTHYIGTLTSKSGFLETFRSLLSSSPPATKGLASAPATSDLFKLAFQPELIERYERRRTSADIEQPSNLGGTHSKDVEASARVHASKTHKSPPRKLSTSSRRRSSASTPHLNLLTTLDIINDQSASPTSATLSISGTHLGTVILQAKKLGSEEADCYFKQLLRGVEYLYSINIAHHDLKPQNLLITRDGLLKISNFTSSEFCGEGKKSKKRCGSIQYLAPEVFVDPAFDARAVDMWAVGLTYLEMRTGKLFWGFAAEGADEGYDKYLVERESLWGFRPIENLSDKSCRAAIRSLLDPCAENRMTASRVLKSTWCGKIELCDAAMGGKSC